MNYIPILSNHQTKEAPDSFKVPLYRCNLKKALHCIAYSAKALTHQRVNFCIKKVFILVNFK